ncbi:hypothetical protein YC2023_108453 [Brassica napus]
MPLDVLGRTRATLMHSTSSHLGRQARDGDRSLQLLVFNEEFLVSASHQLALTTSLPFVHTARRSYRLNDPVKCSDRGDVGGSPSATSREVNLRKDHCRTLETERPENGETSLSVGRFLTVPADSVFWLDRTHSFRISPNPGTKSVKENATKQPAFANPETVFVRKQCCNVKSKTTLGNGYLGSRIDEERSEMRYLSGEASSATDRAQFPWKGAPDRVRAPLCLDPVAPRGAVYESGCLGMQPQSGGKFRPRLNMGERPIANKYRESQRVLEIVGREADGGRRCVLVGCGTEQSGPPIDSGRGLTRIKVGRGGCFVEPSHGIESSKWAIFGKQNWRWGMNRKPGYSAQLRANLEPTKGVGRLRQQDGGHGSRNPLRSV